MAAPFAWSTVTAVNFLSGFRLKISLKKRLRLVDSSRVLLASSVQLHSRRF
jgi:hypothetical protein